MDLYILRHAIAGDSESFNGPDSERPLTKDGAKKMKHIAEELKKLKLRFDIILTSPFLRAKETAAIVAKEFHCENVLKFSSHLKVGGNPAALINEINTTYKKFDNIVLVGHEPYLSALISMLISGKKDLSITMKKGGICKLSTASLVYGRCATLEWLMAPAQVLKEN
ncbi:MAG TPA: phosphohistidine phosphatase SixA [Candidatus Acidoferrales bacterium]|nr:phosphohistidine phosphatase SixA [Candidatus Acidoferrales bacterium]